jgi:diguanylate cyclase (GGDEF)-like protein
MAPGIPVRNGFLMHLDLPTLLLASQLVSTCCGIMFALDFQNASAPFARWFAVAFLSAPLAAVFYLLAGPGSQRLWAFPAGNATATLTVAFTWVGARSVNGRSLPYRTATAVPVLIMIAVLAGESLRGPWTGALPYFLSFSAFSTLAGIEFWRGGVREPRLRQGAVLALVCAINATWFMVRAIGVIVLGTADPLVRTVLGPEMAALLLLVMIMIASLHLKGIARERALRSAERLATRDPLTGLLNRREFARCIDALAPSAGDTPRDYALLLFDLDHFKSINDTHGHPVGDEVLVAFGRVARHALRGEDLLCRYGGEEFAALLPGATRQEAHLAAERVRHQLAISDEDVLVRLRPTTSIGIAAACATAIPLPELLRQADKALYRAKREGRDRVAWHAAEGYEPSSAQ